MTILDRIVTCNVQPIKLYDHVEKKIRTEGKWTEDGLIVKGDFACEENEEDHDIYAYVGDAPAPFDLYHEEKDIFSIADSL